MKTTYYFFFLILVFFSCEDTNKPNLHILEGGGTTFPMIMRSSKPDMIVHAQIDGKTFKLILDTGSPITVINPKKFEEAALQKPVSSIGDKVFYTFIDTQDKKHPIYTVDADTLRLGAYCFLDAQIYAANDLRVDGILGNDILKNFCVKFDFKNDSISFFQNGDSIPAGDFEIPFFWANDKPRIWAKIGDEKRTFTFDTGSDGFIALSENRVKRINQKMLATWNAIVDPLYIFSDTIGYIKRKTNYFVTDISVGDFLSEQEVINASGRNNLIGMNFLLRFEHVIIDYPNQKIYLGNPYKHMPLDRVRSIETNLNSMGVWILPGKIPVVRRLSTAIDTAVFGLGDTVMAINDIKIMNQADTFYNDRYVKVSERAHQLIRSKYSETLLDFYFARDTSTITILKNGIEKTFPVYRQKYYNHYLPDTLHTGLLTNQDADFVRGYKYYRIKKDYENGGHFLYKSSVDD